MLLKTINGAYINSNKVDSFNCDEYYLFGIYHYQVTAYIGPYKYGLSEHSSKIKAQKALDELVEELKQKELKECKQR